jgi:hypothetical protein
MENYYPDDFFNSVADAQEHIAKSGIKMAKITDAVKYEVDKLFNIVKSQIKYNMHNRIVLFELPIDYLESSRRIVLKQIIDGFMTKAQVYALFKIVDYDNSDWLHTEEIEYYVYKEVQSNFEHLPTEYLEYEFNQAELFALEFNEHPTKIFNCYRDKIDVNIIERYL